MHLRNSGPRLTKEHWRNLLHEIEILKRIQSPYCIQLFDAFQSDVAVCECRLVLCQGGGWVGAEGCRDCQRASARDRCLFPGVFSAGVYRWWRVV